MERLLYISTARRALDRGELDAILRKSRLNNAASGVTGILAVGGTRFLQLLEGPGEAVAAVYGKIRQDPRHFAIVTLSHKPIENRQTAGWSMAFEALEPGRGLPELVDALVKEIDDPSLSAEFAQFARRHAA